MRFVTNINEDKFNQFIEQHSIGNFSQTVEWGKFKSTSNWTMELIGMEDGDNNLIAGAMFLRRSIPVIKKSILYAPRGYILDFNNKELLNNFTKELFQYAKKTKAILVKIDPCIKLRERNIEGEVIENGEDNTWLIEELKSLGYEHKGLGLDFNGVQPRFVFKLDINKSKEELLKSFHHKTRYNIRLAEKKGIEIYEGTKKDLVEFERIMRVTGERDNFITRPLSYFEKMYDFLEKSDKMKLFIAKYNLKKALETNEKNLESTLKSKNKDSNRIEKLTKENKELKELITKHKDGIIVSGTILTITGDKAWYLYGASDNIYRNLMPNYLIQWVMIQYSMDKGCKLYDFRGISGDLDPNNHLYGLYRFKKGFNGEFVEYIGEFDLVVNKCYYFIWEFIIPKVMKLLKKLKRRQKK